MRGWIRTVAVSLLAAASMALAPMAAAQVVISQVYGGGGNTGAPYRNDFIELFNRGTAAVEIGGWSVQYASSTGSSWTNKWDIPAGKSIPAGGYFLLQGASGGAVGSTLPTPDVTGSVNMSASAGKVALSNSTTVLTGTCPTGAAIVDFVGFGTAANCSETSPTANLSNTTAALRNGGGCTDTNNNSSDFTIGAPAPRNSASTTNPCSGGPTPPTGAGAANPSSGPVGTAVTFTVTVTPGTNPASTGIAVTLDLTAIGGSSSQRLYDDGGHGDGAAGDNVFGVQTTVAAGTSAGAKTLPFAVTDAQSRTSTGSLNFTVTSATTPPSGVGIANPTSGVPTATVTLTVTVTPGTGPVSSGITVTADLSPIGGAAVQALYDDGGHGDGAAGDNVFGVQTTVGAVTSGAKALPFTVADAQLRSSTGSIAFTVIDPPIAIHEIQGSEATSPKVGLVVTTEGIVTALTSKGFYLEAPETEWDSLPETSEGILVYLNAAPPSQVLVGARVRVSGTVVEYVPSADPNSAPLTELSATAAGITVLSTGNPLPAPVTLTAADTPATQPAAGDPPVLERYEGMRVRVASLTVVGPTGGTYNTSSGTATSNGTFYGVIPGVARPFREEGLNVTDPLPPGAPCCIPRFDENPERLRIASSGLVGSTPVDVTAGATVTEIVGPLDFGYRTYTILPDSAPAVTGQASATPVPDRAASELTVGSFNLLQFDKAAASFSSRLPKAAEAIRTYGRTPDVVGVCEVKTLAALQDLAAKINELAGNAALVNYEAYLVEGNDVGGIDVGFLVNTARVTVVDVTQYYKDSPLAPGSTYPLFDRPPLILRATVTETGFPFSVMVNHLKAIDTATNALLKRQMQSEYVAGLIQARQNDNLIAVGDYNSYQFNDGYVDMIGTITGQPASSANVLYASTDTVDPDATVLTDLAGVGQQYSYTYDGNAQALDHVVANAQVMTRFHRVAYARINSDFPVKWAGEYARPERVSDHDMAVAYFDAFVNHPPVAYPDPFPTIQAQTLTVPAATGVLANDTDQDGQALTAIKVSDPAHGQLTLAANGGFTYLPDTGFAGTDTFTYKANDGMADSNVATVTITVIPTLTASAQATPVHGFVPLDVVLSATAGGGVPPYTYAWAFGDGNTGSGQTAAHAYTGTGTFTVTLTVSDSGGQNRTATTSVIAYGPMSATASANPASGPYPLGVTFGSTASGGLPPYTYAWAFGDGGSGTGATPSHTYTSTGTFVVTLTVTDSAAHTTTASTTVTTYPPLAATAAADRATGPAPLAVQFAGGASGGVPPYSFGWTFGDGGSSGEQNPPHTFAGVGRFTVTLTVADSASHAVTRTLTIAAHALPQAAGLDVDLHQMGPSQSNLNGVLEPGETVVVEPSWHNPGSVAMLLDGDATGFTGPAAENLVVVDDFARYGIIGSASTSNCYETSGDCFALRVTVPATRPAQHWDGVFTESLSVGSTRNWAIHIGGSFNDVPMTQWAYRFIETLYHTGNTTGCGEGVANYCPGRPVSRSQMAVFLARVMAGSDAAVPVAGSTPGGAYSCTPAGSSVFTDVSPTDWACRGIHYAFGHGVTVGCDGQAEQFCPERAVSRGEMAAFVARARTGGESAVPRIYTDARTGRSYSCDPASPGTHFRDVKVTDWNCSHANFLWATGVIDGCDAANGLYCPSSEVSRDQMAKFLTNAFSLKLY